MYLVVGKSNLKALRSFGDMATLLASPRVKQELLRGLSDAGRKTKTQVQKAVTRQMALKGGNYQSYVVANTRGVVRKDILAYDIFSVKGGIRAEEYKGMRAVSTRNRLNKGRRGTDRGEVRSGVWNNPRIFKRSFVGTTEGFYAFRPPSEGTASVTPKALWTFGRKPQQPRGADGKFQSTGVKYGKVRRLFGPALSKELPEDDSLATFMKLGPSQLEHVVAKRLTKLMRF